MSRLAVRSLLAVLWLAAGCSTMQIDSDWNPRARFDSLSTWDWLPGRPAVSTNLPTDLSLVAQRVETALEEGLTARGYQKVAEGTTPSFYVASHVAVDSKLEARTMYSSFGPGVWMGPSLAETYVDEYQQGTLLIDVIDPARREVIWRGRAQARVDDNSSPEKREARVREAVTKILAKFPPPA
jgi:hypothetical protein